MGALVELYAEVGLLGAFALAFVAGAASFGIAHATRRGLGLAIVAAVIAIGTVLTLALLVDRARLASTPGTLEEARFVGDGPTAALLVLDRIPFTGRRKGFVYRLSSVRLADGVRTARTVLKKPATWVGAAGGRAWWFAEETGLTARDPATLNVVAREKNLVDRNPTLAGGVREADLLADGALLLHAKNGVSRFRLDPVTLVATLLAPDAPAVAPPARHGAHLTALLADPPGTASTDGRFIVRRTAAGAESWRHAAADEVRLLTAHGSNVVAVTAHGTFALDARTGAPRWVSPF